jgi:zinc D-Ala-D-Ala carboxypeptidase
MPNIVVTRDYQISPNFTVGMLVRTDNRKFLDKNLTSSQYFLDNLYRLCSEVLEPVRTLMGGMSISSCFRCKELNSAIGGAKNSQHTVGEAADTEYPGATAGAPLKAAFNKIAFSSIPYSQIIFEFGEWIHIGLIDQKLYPNKKGEKLVATRVGGKTVYTAVINPI